MSMRPIPLVAIPALMAVLQADINAGAFPRDGAFDVLVSNAFSNVRDFLALNFAPPCSGLKIFALIFCLDPL